MAYQIKGKFVSKAVYEQWQTEQNNNQQEVATMEINATIHNDSEVLDSEKPFEFSNITLPDVPEMEDYQALTDNERQEIEAEADALIRECKQELPNNKTRIRIVETTYGEFYRNIYPKLIINRAYQRTKVWEDERKNLFIDSCLQDFFCGMMCIHGDDLLDGSQRSSTYANTINGIFIPSDLSEDFEELNNKQFAAWPEESRNQFLNAILVLVYMPYEWDEERAIEQYYRINNGKPHTTMEINKGKTRNIRQALQDSIKHTIWKLEAENAKQEKISAFGKLKEDGIEKIYFNLCYLLYGENQDFKEKNMIKWVISWSPASHVWADIRKRTTILYNIFVQLRKSNDGVKAMKYYCKKIHMLSLLAAVDEKTSTENAANNLYKYWEMATKKDAGDKTDKAIVSQYKNLCSEGTNDTDAIKKRLTFIRNLIHKD